MSGGRGGQARRESFLAEGHGQFRASVVAGMILAALASSPAVAGPVRVPGTSTSLQPPNGFSLAEEFPGFKHAELRASIMVTEMPAPAAEVMKGMTREGLATRGMTLISSKAEMIGGREALLLQVAQKAVGAEFLKWMLVTGDQKASVMVVGTFPSGSAGEIGAAIRDSVLSVAWTPRGPSDPFEGLQFRVTPTPKLKVAGRMSDLVMLTESGTMGSLGPTDPLYIVGRSITDSRIGDLPSFSEARARQTAQIRDVQNVSGHALTVGGLAAYELVADAKDVKTGRAMRLYQVVMPEGGGYLIAQGLVGAERGAELLAEFRRVTASLRRTAAGGESLPTRR